MQEFSGLGSSSIGLTQSQYIDIINFANLRIKRKTVTKQKLNSFLQKVSSYAQAKDKNSVKNVKNDKILKFLRVVDCAEIITNLISYKPKIEYIVICSPYAFLVFLLLLDSFIELNGISVSQFEDIGVEAFCDALLEDIKEKAKNDFGDFFLDDRIKIKLMSLQDTIQENNLTKVADDVFLYPTFPNPNCFITAEWTIHGIDLFLTKATYLLKKSLPTSIIFDDNQLSILHGPPPKKDGIITIVDTPTSNDANATNNTNTNTSASQTSGENPIDDDKSKVNKPNSISSIIVKTAIGMGLMSVGYYILTTKSKK